MRLLRLLSPLAVVLLATTCSIVNNVDEPGNGGSAGTSPTVGGGGGGTPTGTRNVCGDGRTAGDEECDDGNADDTDGCTSDCLLAFCGDGIVRAGVEECDDGNQLDIDACTGGCLLAVCGDGIVHAGVEGCDDANDIDDDECNNECQLTSCGDGASQPGEECDDANDDNTDACTSLCRNAICGDGFVRSGFEECDDAGASAECDDDCTAAECGDQTVNSHADEECDDGDDDNTDACTTECTLAECGDGYVQGGESCDDGGQSATCEADCTPVGCGDQVVNTLAGEECDDGNSNNHDSCTNSCLLAECGDGWQQPGEECDEDDLAGQSCASFNFDVGVLSCDADCQFDLSGCSNDPCPSGGAFVNGYCWYPSTVCEDTATKCASVGLIGNDGFITVQWDMTVMQTVADRFGLVAGGVNGCCVEFAWIQNGTLYTHNWGTRYNNWPGCPLNASPTLKACLPP